MMDILSETGWTQQYLVLKNEIKTFRQKGTSCDNQTISNLNLRFKSLEKDLKTLSSSPMEFELSASEIARRNIITDNLKKQLNILVAISSTSAPSSSSPTTYNTGFNSQFTSNNNNNTSVKISEVAMNPINSNSNSNSNSNLTDKGLLQRQEEVIKMQDAVLNDIGRGVDRLHVQAKAIGEEAKVHIKILNSLDTDVDLATEGLRAEAKHAHQIREKSRACYMYVCVAVEVLVIIILLVVLFSTHH